ncbi:MAG: hypothetical protein KR126chlam1_00030 [Chlamydiae bacterium]|nr:hypothetical protein [Chlamydiota bacterium]
MRYVVTPGQVDHFVEEGFIEFEELFTPEQASTLHALLEKSHAQKPSGYDLHREDPSLEKALHFSKLTQMGAPLFQKHRLRIGYTLYPVPTEGSQILEETSSITDLLGGLLINFDGETPGSGLFFSPTFAIDYGEREGSSLLIVFAGKIARYVSNEADPHKNELKKMSYGAGGLLSDETHHLYSPPLQ